MNSQIEEQAELRRKVHVIACAALGLDDEDHEDDELAEPLEKAIFTLLAKQKEDWVKEAKRLRMDSINEVIGFFMNTDSPLDDRQVQKLRRYMKQEGLTYAHLSQKEKGVKK